MIGIFTNLEGLNFSRLGRFSISEALEYGFSVAREEVMELIITLDFIKNIMFPNLVLMKRFCFSKVSSGSIYFRLSGTNRSLAKFYPNFWCGSFLYDKYEGF